MKKKKGEDNKRSLGKSTKARPNEEDDRPTVPARRMRQKTPAIQSLDPMFGILSYSVQDFSGILNSRFI